MMTEKKVQRARPNSPRVKVEALPWANGKHTLTRAYMIFLAQWARKLSWKETALSFRTSWEKVFNAVEWVVDWGLSHRELGTIRALGVDEAAGEQQFVGDRGPVGAERGEHEPLAHGSAPEDRLLAGQGHHGRDQRSVPGGVLRLAHGQRERRDALVLGNGGVGAGQQQPEIGGRGAG